MKLSGVMLWGCLCSLAVCAEPIGTVWPVWRGDAALTGRAWTKLPPDSKLLWRWRTGGPIHATAVIDATSVYVGSDDKYCYALDRKTGRKRWSTKLKGSIRAGALLAGGRVFVCDDQGWTHALDPATGKILWKHEAGAEIFGGPNYYAGKTPLVIVSSYDETIYALDPKTGKEVWAVKTGNYVNASMAISGSRGVIGGCDGVLRCVDLADGEEVWSVDWEMFIASSCAIVDGVVYAVTIDGECAALSLKTGKEIWRVSVLDAAAKAAQVTSRKQGERVFTSPAVALGRVVVGTTHGRVVCLDAKTGKSKWVFRAGKSVDSSCVIVASAGAKIDAARVVFGSDDGRAYMVSLATGKFTWRIRMGRECGASPAVADGQLVLGAWDGWVYCFGKKP